MASSETGQQEAPRGPALRDRIASLRARMTASPRMNAVARRLPFLRGIARHTGQDLFDLMAGFVYSQVLAAVAELGWLPALEDGPRSAEDLAGSARVPLARAQALCDAAAALEILHRRRDGRYGLGRLGAAVLAVPGLLPMIRHHALLYRDLTDPLALMRGEAAGEISAFWSYTGGNSPDSQTAAAYSEIMAATQGLVAEETLGRINLRRARVLMDVGGGNGTFLIAAARRWPHLTLRLFDLPQVTEGAAPILSCAGVTAECLSGSFDDAALPPGADVITLIRVLFDHDDARARMILSRAFEALAPGGQIVISEQMSGGERPVRAADAYFGLYTMAMTTGRPRSPAEYSSWLADAGFVRPRRHRGTLPFVTSVLSAEKPSA